MDPGLCEDLTGRLDSLLIVPEDRLDCDDAPVIHQFTGASHDALALEEIADARARANQSPPASELVRELAAHG